MLRALAVCLVAACSAAGPGGPGASAGADAPPDAEVQPSPAAGDGVADPQSASLHDHGCAGVDWQLLGGWLSVAHQVPALAAAGELDTCVARYAGWVTNEADAAHVSRASVYAALAATGQCDAAHDYDGALVSGELCASVHPDLDAEACAAQMAASRGFGIHTLAQVIAASKLKDPPLVAAYVATGSATCGGSDRWKLVAPAGFVDHYVAAYNSVHALTATPPSCKKKLVVTVALYTGMADPVDANGCWTYERVAKDNSEWKICNYDGTTYHPGGTRWAYDDTNTYNDATTETNRITACRSGVPVGGYIYMANRGSGWRQVTSTGVRSHFAELYSSQTAIDDQFAIWKAAGEPGAPMVNFGEAATTAAQIETSTARACAEVPDKDWFGVYIYPQTLDGARLAAMVKALDACTEN